MRLTTPECLAPLLDKPVAVFGAGVSGDGVRALAAAVGVSCKVYDAKGTPFDEPASRDHSLVVFSPGFTPDHPWLALARRSGAECLGELDFASLFWRGQIVTITGTNGKTTLTEFLTHALRSVGREAHATGNIGHSFSQLSLDLAGGSRTSLAVCEVSSFQAETLRHFTPAAVLWTNFAEDHLERHPGLRSYFSAKWRLVEKLDPERAVAAGFPVSSGAAFVGTSVRRYAERFEVPLKRAVCVETEGCAADKRLEGTVFADYPQRENFILARAWWVTGGLDESALHAAAATFKLGRHRMTRVAEVAGVTYWNDSKATNFHAVEAALSRFEAPVVLIAGGKAKGGDLSGFVQRISPRVQHVVLIGATADELARHCVTFGVSHTKAGTLAAAMRRVSEIAPRGGHVLMSPGFASFDQFRSYEDRGEQFEQHVRELLPAGAAKACASAPKLR